MTHPPIHIEPGPGDLWAFSAYRYPLLAPPNDKTWARSFAIDASGNIESDASLTVSGRHVETPDAAGHYRVRRVIPGNYMIGAWSDLKGSPAVVARGNIVEDGNHSWPFSAINDATGEECARIDNDGTLTCRSVKTEDGATGVYRIGPAVVTLENGRIMKVEGIAPIRT